MPALKSLSTRVGAIVIGAFLIVEALALVPSAYQFRSHMIDQAKNHAVEHLERSFPSSQMSKSSEVFHFLENLIADHSISGAVVWLSTSANQPIQIGDPLMWANPSVLESGSNASWIEHEISNA